MRYDRDGFPIPSEFDLPPRHELEGGRPPAARRPTAGVGKRRTILLLAVGLVIPALFLPVVLPAVREGVVQWSLERALEREAQGHPREAIAEVGRAIRWADDDGRLQSRLLCWRAQLRLESGDAAGAVTDASQAATLTPTASLPHRVRALAHVMLQDADAALSDANAAVEMAGGRQPEALNHRAYIRALVGRQLPEALADVEAALGADIEAAPGEPDDEAEAATASHASPEFLDTRGFVLHLLGRHAEAVDDLNRAIGVMQRRRRQAALATGHVDPIDLARELRGIDQALAVMHQHRGLACQALGLAEQARQDFEIATQKGYDPARGIF
jgi:tetratricopeptide (TPR) repeat protein